MGLLDEITGMATGGQGGGGNAAAAAMELLKNHPGGISGLVQSFQQNGLGDMVSSWVGTGQNQPVSAEQVQSVLSSDQIAQFAAKAGLPAGVATSALAQLLPMVVDKLTPDGKVTEASLLDAGMNFLKNRMGSA